MDAGSGVAGSSAHPGDGGLPDAADPVDAMKPMDAAEPMDASEPMDAAEPMNDGGSADADAPGHDAAADGGMDAAADAAADAGSTPDAGASFDICGTPVDIDDYVTQGSEFIFDVATSAANTVRNEFGALLLQGYIGQITVTRFPWLERPAGCQTTACYNGDAYRDLLFEDSDTSRSILNGISHMLGAGGTEGIAVLGNEDLRDSQVALNQQLAGDPVLIAPALMPNDRIALQLAAMDRWAPLSAAWYTATAWAPSAGGGYFLDDPAGIQMIERGIALGVPTFIVRKGLPLSGFSPSYGAPSDVGPVADTYPEARFLILHAAFEHGLSSGETSEPDGTDYGWGPQFGRWPEGPYDEIDTAVQARYPLNRGVNSLIRSLRTAGIGPNENVYAVLNVVWAHLITRPIEAAHVLGKLLRYVGEDNILWGTESVFYGGPAPQIEAFRNFQIPADMRAEYGYPELTPERKAKILGLNAARVFCVLP